MLHQAAAPSMRPSSQRPVPLKGRDDLVVQVIEYKQVPYPVIKDPCALKYYRLQPEQYAALQLLDSKRSLEEIRDALQSEFPTVPFTLRSVQQLIQDLHEKGLLLSDRPGRGIALLQTRRERKWKQFWNVLKNPMYIRLPGWDPERFLRVWYPLVRWMFHPVFTAAMVLLMLSSWVFLLMRFGEVRAMLPEFHQFFGWPNLLYLWLTLAFAKIMHELGHAFFCKHFGGECHGIGVMLLVFSPTLYCDVTDSWMLRSKWKRIAIGGAGMYVEVILASIAIFLWYNLQEGILKHLCLNLFFVSTVTTVIFNANPLLRFDGYYMLSDYMEIPNLRQKASRTLQEYFAWYCLGIELPEDPFMPKAGKPWFLLYTVASFLYRWFIMFVIVIFLYTVLKPYQLQSIGVMLAIISVGSMVLGLFMSAYRVISMPRTEPMSRPKIAFSLSVLAALIAAACLIPFPWYRNAPFVIEPVDVKHVFTSVPGALVEVRARQGDVVATDDVLAVLENPGLTDRVLELETEVEAQAVMPDIFRRVDDSVGVSVAEQRLRGLREQLADARQLTEQLVVRSPAAGIVIEPPYVPEPTLQETEFQLPDWYGTPLEPRNLLATLDERTQLCSIAPVAAGERPEQTADTPAMPIRYRAVLLIDQSDRDDIAVGDEVRLKLDHMPHVKLTGIVEEISERHLEFAPRPLSNKYGGELPTVTDSQGRERLTSIVYQGLVVLDEDPEILRTDMRGKARFIVDKRTAVGWLWRLFRETFHFRL
jgi:putative peptide zinc metalloprotease protein